MKIWCVKGMHLLKEVLSGKNCYNARVRVRYIMSMADLHDSIIAMPSGGQLVLVLHTN